MSEIVVERFQAMTAGLADATERSVLQVLAAFQAGEIGADDLTQWVAVLVGRANGIAVGLADSSLSAQIEDLTGSPTPPTGIPPVDDAGRLAEAVTTILADAGTDTVMQFSRLARAEPIAASQRASVEAMAHHDLVEGWTRQMDGDPCELCRWWSRNGRVWPKNHPFQRHPGCNCQPRVVLQQNIQSTEYTRRMERNA